MPVAFRTGAIRAVRDYIDRALAGGLKFDLVFTFVCFFSVLGLFIDVYAHSQGMAPAEGYDSVFHRVLVGAFGAVTLLLAATFAANRLANRESENVVPTAGPLLFLRRPASQWLPLGYDVTLLGVAIYGVSIVGDFFWHEIFGVERNVEALFSPTHLGLLVGAALFRTGPLRSAWLRTWDTAYSGWRGLWPAIMSATYLLFALMVFTLYVSPFGLTAAATRFTSLGAGPSAAGDMSLPLDWVLVVGISGVFLHTAIVMGIVLLLVERWGTKLPRGTFTFMLTISTAAIAIIRADCSQYTISPCDQFLATGILPLVGVGFATGVFADVLLHALAPSAASPWRFRLFSMVVPVVLYLLYFVALRDTANGIWWSTHVWTGMIIIPGTLGYVMSFLVLQPPSGTRPASSTARTGEAPAD